MILELYYLKLTDKKYHANWTKKIQLYGQYSQLTRESLSKEAIYRFWYQKYTIYVTIGKSAYHQYVLKQRKYKKNVS